MGFREKSKFEKKFSPPDIKRSLRSPVVLQGWLYKQGSDGLMRWKKRWFVLSDYCLFYYTGPEEKKLLGSILLPSYKISTRTTEKKTARKFAFKIDHFNMKSYCLAADSRENLSQWVKVLTDATLLKDPEFEDGFPLEMMKKPLNLRRVSYINHNSSDDNDSGFHGFRFTDYPSQVSRGNSTPISSGSSDKDLRFNTATSAKFICHQDRRTSLSSIPTIAHQPHHHQLINYCSKTQTIPRNYKERLSQVPPKKLFHEGNNNITYHQAPVVQRPPPPPPTYNNRHHNRQSPGSQNTSSSSYVISPVRYQHNGSSGVVIYPHKCPVNNYLLQTPPTSETMMMGSFASSLPRSVPPNYRYQHVRSPQLYATNPAAFPTKVMTLQRANAESRLNRYEIEVVSPEQQRSTSCSGSRRLDKSSSMKRDTRIIAQRSEDDELAALRAERIERRRKMKQQEEIMKNLFEWKQRIIKSPLNKKPLESVDYSERRLNKTIGQISTSKFDESYVDVRDDYKSLERHSSNSDLSQSFDESSYELLSSNSDLSPEQAV